MKWCCKFFENCFCCHEHSVNLGFASSFSSNANTTRVFKNQHNFFSICADYVKNGCFQNLSSFDLLQDFMDFPFSCDVFFATWLIKTNKTRNIWKNVLFLHLYAVYITFEVSAVCNKLFITFVNGVVKVCRAR